MTRKRAGFFSEFGYNDSACLSIYDALGSSAQPNEADIVGYLRSGTVDSVSPTIVRDVLDEKRSAIGSLAILTDGEWEWRSDFSYYVERYHVAVPVEFVQHMKNNQWAAPDPKNPDSPY